MTRRPFKPLPSKAAAAELETLGLHINIARRRRRLTIQQLAEAAGVSALTISSLEKGYPGVSLGTLAMALLALGQNGLLGAVLAPEKDEIGTIITINQLPKRIRPRKDPQNLKAPAEFLDKTVKDKKYQGF